MTLDGFMLYLLSPEGAALNLAHTCVFQDMNQPLAHYFISCSHNTYLTDSQIGGPSSTEAYVRYHSGGDGGSEHVWEPVWGWTWGSTPALGFLGPTWGPVHCPALCHPHDTLPIHPSVRRAFAQGCRCVELDCWEGPGGEPVIYHGHTLTSKILFRDVIQAVRDHAFTVSPGTPTPSPRAFPITSAGLGPSKRNPWDFPGGPVVKTVLPLQGARVRSLVRELRSCSLRGAAKKTPKQKTPQNKRNPCPETHFHQVLLGQLPNGVE